jgi:DNA-binding LacI/PurR family transcriptional regulator
MAKKTTIATIAAEVGVSVPTVSKVLNGRADVAVATRTRVEDALARHNYRKPVSAGDRSTPRRGRLLEVVAHAAYTAWAQEFLHGVGLACAQNRLGLVLSELAEEHTPSREWMDDMIARRPIGVLFLHSTVSAEQRHHLTSRSIPFVVVDTDGQPLPGVPTVGSNNWAGGLAATRHLIGLGHRRIAVISGPSGVLCSRARVDGYRSALEEAGAQLDHALVRWGDFYVEGGRRHALDLLQLPDRPTAIFAGSDYQALGVIRAATELGLSVPHDLSVVGYDDLPITEWLNPPLTTIRQPLAEMASHATHMLIDLSEGRRPLSTRVELMTDLVVRGSTAAPPA